MAFANVAAGHGQSWTQEKRVAVGIELCEEERCRNLETGNIATALPKSQKIGLLFPVESTSALQYQHILFQIKTCCHQNPHKQRHENTKTDDSEIFLLRGIDSISFCFTKRNIISFCYKKLPVYSAAYAESEKRYIIIILQINKMK